MQQGSYDQYSKHVVHGPTIPSVYHNKACMAEATCTAHGVLCMQVYGTKLLTVQLPWRRGRVSQHTLSMSCLLVPSTHTPRVDIPPPSYAGCSQVREAAGLLCCLQHQLVQGLKQGLDRCHPLLPGGQHCDISFSVHQLVPVGRNGKGGRVVRHVENQVSNSGR